MRIRIRRRITIGIMMLLVAGVAVAIVVPGEYRKQVECSRLAREVSLYEEKARANDRDHDLCLNEWHHEPYDSKSRSEANRENLCDWQAAITMKYDGRSYAWFWCESWEEEAEFHRVVAGACRELAESNRQKRTALKKGLLLSFLQ
jgi:hypothetical protein